MRKNYLFPTTFRKIGWCLFVPFAITSFICLFDGSNEDWLKVMTNSSRNRIQKAADAGFVMANGKAVKSSYKVKPMDVITVMMVFYANFIRCIAQTVVTSKSQVFHLRLPEQSFFMFYYN